MIRPLEAFIVWLDRTAAPWVQTVHDEALAISTRRWLERMRRECPVGSMVRCRCGRCCERDGRERGRLWIVHEHDPDTCDLRVYDAAAGIEPLRDPWPLSTWTLDRGVEVTWLSTGMRSFELVERPPPWALEAIEARSARGGSPE
jgi:hypothetical protein